MKIIESGKKMRMVKESNEEEVEDGGQCSEDEDVDGIGEIEDE